MLELRGLQKTFGDGKADSPAAQAAVRDVTLTIKDGEFFSLLGPSGCGKTTLLRMIAGFETPSAGEIHFGNRRIDVLPANQRQFNMVFQRYALFPHLTVQDNVAFGLRMKKVSDSELWPRVQEALSLVQMQEYSGRAIQTLSGGQQQRVALARALVNRPQVLLLDEPLSALDLKLRQQMQVELAALQRRLKHAFVFVTHDQEEALTLSDRIAVMNNGMVEQVGTPQEIYEFPRTPFVAQFIGSMNAFDGTVKAIKEDAIEVAVGALKRPMLVKAPRDGLRPLPSVGVGASAKVMVRPEKLKLLKSQPGPEQNSVEGQVRDVIYLGSVTHFSVVTKDGEGLVQVAQPNTALTARKGFGSGDKVFVAWAPEDALLMATGVPASTGVAT